MIGLVCVEKTGTQMNNDSLEQKTVAYDRKTSDHFYNRRWGDILTNKLAQPKHIFDSERRCLRVGACGPYDVIVRNALP